MAVCFMGWLQCTDTLRTADSIAIAIGNDVIAPLRHEEFTLFRAEIAPGAQRMIAETTRCARKDMRMR
jgi:hypothetical protein